MVITHDGGEFPKYFIIHNNSQPSLAGPGASQNSNWASLRQECEACEGVAHKCCVNHLKIWSLFPGHWDTMSWSAEWRRFIKQLRPQMLQSSKIRNQWVAVPLSKQIPSWLKIWRMPHSPMKIMRTIKHFRFQLIRQVIPRDGPINRFFILKFSLLLTTDTEHFWRLGPMGPQSPRTQTQTGLLLRETIYPICNSWTTAC